ncbi:fibronectin type III domain-containing protein [Cohnella panacarvi]|uniref:RCC1 domain-containing protein n=1 Tax=Cohnella panacarvi TaxID=400776 RepID=UPI00047AA936|nr:fibronectin type III domain-containing protein [Cohnella panacarvi]
MNATGRREVGFTCKLLLCAWMGTFFFSFVALREASAAELPRMNTVEAAGNRSFALAEDGRLWSWGVQFQNSDPFSMNPMKIVESGVSQVSAGRTHMLYVRNNVLWALGDNSHNQIAGGSSQFYSNPKRIDGISDVKAAAAGNFHTVALKTDNTLWEWGDSPYDFSSQRPLEERSIPIQVPHFTGDDSVEAVFAGENRTFAVNSEGEVFAWGYNGNGELGIGMNVAQWETPARVPDLTDVKSVDAGSNFTIALKTDGTLWAWGSNECGIFGVSSPTRSYSRTPVQVKWLSDIVEVAVGDKHAIALGADGKVRSWGCPMYGSGSYRHVPVVVNIPGNVKSIDAGAHHSLAVTDDGRLWGWGDNDYNKVGPVNADFLAEPLNIKYTEFKPSGLTAQPGPGKVRLTWTTQSSLASDIESHVIRWRLETSGTYTEAELVGVSDTGVYTFEVPNLKYYALTDYVFNVYAVSSATGTRKKSTTSDSIFAKPQRVITVPFQDDNNPFTDIIRP